MRGSRSRGPVQSRARGGTSRSVPTPTPQLQPAFDPPPPPPPPETPPSDPPAEATDSKTDPPPKSTLRPRGSASKSPARDLPVITVAQARTQLEPKVRACMQKAKAHHLPKKPDLTGVKATIASFDDAVKACARKHGVEGSRAVFNFKMDGPSGKVTSVGSTYLSKSFRSCAKAIYQKAAFPKVQQASYGVTYTLEV
jgi:hypothetical protein